MRASASTSGHPRHAAARIAAFLWLWTILGVVFGIALLAIVSQPEAPRCDEASMRRSFFQGLTAQDEATRSALAERLARCISGR